MNLDEEEGHGKKLALNPSICSKRKSFEVMICEHALVMNSNIHFGHLILVQKLIIQKLYDDGE